MKQKIWKITRPMLRPVGAVTIVCLFYLLRIFPIKKNKVLACVSAGRRYDDNQKFIIRIEDPTIIIRDMKRILG